MPKDPSEAINSVRARLEALEDERVQGLRNLLADAIRVGDEERVRAAALRLGLSPINADLIGARAALVRMELEAAEAALSELETRYAQASEARTRALASYTRDSAEWYEVLSEFFAARAARNQTAEQVMNSKRELEALIRQTTTER